MPILETNPGQFNTLPGPVRSITCQSGQVIVIDKTTEPPTATTLNADDSYAAEGKAGLGISDIDGSRIYWESSNEADNRTSSQLVVAPDVRAEQNTDAHGEEITSTLPGNFTIPDNRADAAEYPEVVGATEVKGDADPSDGHETGTYESRSKASLYELAKERELDVTSKSTKDELIAALRGE